MPENRKPKKLRLYKFASEYNLATETLVDFLKDKGYEVKGHMALLTDEMLIDIGKHFKKDIEKAEKHYKKISEFQKKYSDKKDEEPQAEEPEEEQPEPEPEEAKEEKVEEAEVPAETEESAEPEPEEEPQAEEPDEDEPEPEEEEPEEEFEEEPQLVTSDSADEEEAEAETGVVETEDTAEKVEEPEEEPAEEPAAEEEPEPEEPEEEVKPEGKFRTQTEIDLAKRNKGLRVVGKIDLEPKKKHRDKKAAREDEIESGRQGKKRPPKPGKAAKEAESEIAAKGDKTGGKEQFPKDAASDDSKNKKRKKKKLRAKKRGEADDQDDAGKKRKRKGKKFEVDKEEVDAAIKRTMLSMDESGSSDRSSARKKKKKIRQEETEKRLEEEQQHTIQKISVTEYIAVNELANLMDVPVGDVIQKCISMGLMVSINQRLDFETITLVADEFGFEVEQEEEYAADLLEDKEDPAETLKSRSPVVTIMGHVDHGKTSLLDYIRKENVVAGESGGITQHIGAYKVKLDDGREIAFLDTPGHEAFTAMRARGAKVTDIVVLIVAADDAVMPQTVEAINHAQAAGVPIVVAINKVDKPSSNVEKIKQQLAERNVLVEDWGGKYQNVEISAKTGHNIDLLLEKLLLEAEILELKANPDRMARGTVIESQLDKGRGITATVLVQKGVMRIGDPFVAGNFHGRVRAMFDERNNKIEEAGPATPALVLGFEGAPQAGDAFVVVGSEREAREVAQKRQQLKREQDHRQVRHMTLDEVANQISTGGVKELALVVKGDVDGSVEALSDSLMKLSNQEVQVQVIHRGVGAISEGDVLLAAASDAIIVGFHVRPHTNARKLAETEHVDIRLYNVIYDAINEVKSALEGLLSPVISEENVATIEVRDTFKVPKVGTVAGCYVQQGKINRNDKIRLFRDGVEVYSGELATLKRFKDDVKEVDAGYECGLNIHNFNDIKVGDIIEAYKIVETKKKLEE